MNALQASLLAAELVKENENNDPIYIQPEGTSETSETSETTETTKETTETPSGSTLSSLPGSIELVTGNGLTE